MKHLIFIAMHFLLVCSVSIGDLDASPFVDEIEVRSGWKELIDDATITLPKKLMEYNLIDIHPGQEVSINLGYEGYTRDVFKGYVSRVNPKVPLEILCEDAGWLYKQTNINKSWLSSVTLKEILTYVNDEVNKNHPNRTNVTIHQYGLPDITFDKFRIPNKNAAQVLQTFKEPPYNLASYFQDHELLVHLAYNYPGESQTLGEVEYFLPGHEIANVTDADRLEYLSANDRKVEVRSIVIKPDNSYTEKKYGEPGGDQLTLTFTSANSDPAIIKELSETTLKRFGEGYKGSLTTLMVPYARHGMTARVVDAEFGRDERYHIDETVLKFGDGITIDVSLGIKV